MIPRIIIQKRLNSKTYEVSGIGFTRFTDDVNEIINEIYGSVGACYKCKFSYYIELSTAIPLMCSKFNNITVKPDWYCGDFKERPHGS